MVQLYEAAYGYVGDAKRFSDLKAAIRKCVQNFERFCDFHSRLLHLCRHIDIEVQGLFCGLNYYKLQLTYILS